MCAKLYDFILRFKNYYTPFARYLLALLVSIWAQIYLAHGQVASSWRVAQEVGKGSIVVYHVDADAFITEKDGKTQGLEYQIMKAFQEWVKKIYDIDLSLEFVYIKDFQKLYAKAVDGRSGQFFASAFSITEARKQEVNFSPPYMPDINIMVSHPSIPIIQDTSNFIDNFSRLTAVTIPNSIFERPLLELKANLLPKLRIEYEEQYDRVYERLDKEKNLFSYVPLPDYLLKKQKGYNIKRQNLFKFELAGFGIVYPKTSDWQEPMERIFNDPEFKEHILACIRRVFGKDMNRLLRELSSNEASNDRKEIEILTKEKELQYKQLDAQSETLQRQQFLIIALIIGAVLAVSVFFLMWKQYQIKQRANKLLTFQNLKIEQQKNELINQTEELTLQKEQIQTQQAFIEEKNEALQRSHKKITDSIRTAKSIQYALLPFENRVNEAFENNFVIFLPKDIVSGDFYWLAQVENKTIVAVIDCTGHGVPGAFMTSMAYAMFNEIIISKKIYDPAQILEKLHEYVILAFQTQQNTNHQPGMDVCLCCLERLKNKEVHITFSGAKRPLYFFRKDQDSINVIKGDRQSIGGWEHDPDRLFTNHALRLASGDLLYLTTDGFMDTPSPKRWSFGNKRFIALLEEIHQKPMAHQHELMIKAWDDYRQGQEQRDDITILGIRL